MTKAHVFPYSPRPGTRTAVDDAVPPDAKRERGARLRALSDELSRRRWRARVGTVDRVLVDRPGRGYADDYTPWLVRRRRRQLRPRARDRCGGRGGARRCRLIPIASSAGSSAEGDHVHAADGFVAIRDIAPKAPTHLLVLPERHVDTFRDVDDFPDEEAGRMLRFVAETARLAGLEDYRVIVNVGPRGGQTVFHLHWHVLGGDSLPGFE